MKKESFLKGLKIIFKYLAEYKKDLVVLSILGVISAIANGVVPYIAGRLFDAILKPSKIFIGTKIEISLFLFLIIFWLVIRIIADFINWRIRLKSENIGYVTYSHYLIKAFSHLLELPLFFHKEQKPGKINEKINRAANWMSLIASDIIIDLTPQFLSIIVALIISFFIKPLLAFFLLFGVFTYLFVLIKTVAPLAKIQRRVIRISAEAHGNVYGTISNIQSVKQSVTENHEKKIIFKKFTTDWIIFRNKLNFIWQNLSFYQRILISSIQFIVFSVSAFLIWKGQMTIGELAMFNGYAVMLFGPFVTLGHKWQSIQNGLIAIQEAEKIFNLQTENYVPKNAVILDDIKGEIVFDKVSFAYQKRQNNVLDNISFKVTPGEIIALVGESGEGKSTLIDLISGYYFAQKGKVLIDGHNVKNFDLKFLRSKIAVVPQEVVLFNDTVKKNVSYGSFSASDKKIENAVRMAHADEFIDSFPKKYNQVVGERGIKLSVGQKQRVAIARAILRDPRILILDEPTSALDAKSENFIQGSLEELMRGRTTFIIAHRLSTVRKADRIIVLKDGNIAEQGKHDNLIKIPNGIYRHLYELQVGLK